jgi:predicted nucleic acid-binding protein
VRPVVADASAIVEYLLRTNRARAAAKVIEAPDVALSVPSLCDVEVAAALRRALLEGRLHLARVREAIVDYQDLPIDRYAHLFVLDRILELRANFSAYDATYVAVAEQLHAEFLTADRPLARAARSHTSLQVHLAE